MTQIYLCETSLALYLEMDTGLRHVPSPEAYHRFDGGDNVIATPSQPA